MRLFLQKQEKNIEKNKAENNERLPYFRLVVPPEEGQTEWKEVAAFWKGAKGYSGKIVEGVTISFIKKELTADEKEKLAAIKGISND